MGPIKSLLQFLFGKEADIFDENGQVRHKLAERKWVEWNNRIKQNPDYDWRQHKGTQNPLPKK